MARLFGVEFAPLAIPLERRLQTLGIVFMFFVSVFSPLVLLGLMFILLLCAPLLVLAYFVWLWRDWDTPSKGSYPSKFFRNLRVHRWCFSYFPIKMHTTADLPDDKNYLIGLHPHGIVAIAANNFLTNASGIDDRYPNITFRVCTLVSQFYTPIRREWYMLHGLISVAKESIRYVLGGSKKGQAVVILIGGAEEALEAHPGKHVLVLKNRKGFVKMALTTGAQLVPCFAFGENDAYVQASNEKGTLKRRIQTLIKDLTSWSLPMFHGRGIFNYTFGILPYRKAMNTVLGAPIPVEKCESPTEEQVNALHALYVEKLTELYETNKERYGVDEDNHLDIR